MPTEIEIQEAKRHAESTIRNTWKDIAGNYTIGWGGPIEAIEGGFPFVRKVVLDIRDRISTNLPIVIFQARTSPEKDSVFVVPFWKDSGNPYNSRIATIRELNSNESQRLAMFAQSFWFLIEHKSLPNPSTGDLLEKALRRWTGRQFFE